VLQGVQELNKLEEGLFQEAEVVVRVLAVKGGHQQEQEG
jgi:hypothetical protein